MKCAHVVRVIHTKKTKKRWSSMLTNLVHIRTSFLPLLPTVPPNRVQYNGNKMLLEIPKKYR
jgi:hypothetical protein